MKISILRKSFYLLLACLWLGWSAVVQAAPPTITSVWPASTTPGTAVFVFGTDFSQVWSENEISYGGVRAPMAHTIDSTLLIFFIPSGGTSGQVCVSTSAGSSCLTPSVCSGLCITGMWPAAVASVGDVVFIFGSGFTPAMKVKVNGVTAPLTQLIDPGLLLFFIPAGVVNPIAVEVCDRIGKCSVFPQPGCNPNTGDLDTVVSKVLVFSFNPVLTNVTRPVLDPNQDPLKTCKAADPSIYADVTKTGDVSKLPFRLNEYLCVNGYLPLFARSGAVVARDFFDRVSNASRGKDASGCPRFKYQLVDVVEADAWPLYSDGFQYTNESFVAEHALFPGRLFFHGGGGAGALSDVQFFKMANLDRRVMDGEIDEVIFHTYGDAAWESWMVGEGAFNINGSAIQTSVTTSTRAYPIHFGCFECFNHRLEFTLTKMFGSWNGFKSWDGYSSWNGFPATAVPAHAWDRFTRIDSQEPGKGNIGYAHRPFNARCEYDFKDGERCKPPLPTPYPIATNADDWYSYPKMTGDPALVRKIGCVEWGCDENYWDVVAPHDGYALWFMRHIPRAGGVNDGLTGFGVTTADKGMLNNWWRYLFDVDQFKLGDGRLNPDSTPPSVSIQPSSPASSNMVTVKVDVTDQNPIYRVDLYYIGANNQEIYIATDTMRPYVFRLASNVSPTFPFETKVLPSGTYKLRAKAYNMPDGLQGVSDDILVRPISLIDGCSIALNLTGSTKTVAQKPLSFTLSANQAVTFSTQDLPQGATVSTTSTSISFSWTPRLNQRGAQWIRFSAINSGSGCQALRDVQISVDSPPAIYQLTDLNLRKDGKRMGVLSVAIDPQKSNVIYAGTRGKGFFRTQNNGADGWQQINNGGLILSGTGTVDGTALAVHPFLSDVVYGGTRYPGALYLWNLGEWFRLQPLSPVNGDSLSAFFSIAIDPIIFSRIFVGTNKVAPVQNLIGSGLSSGQAWTSLIDPANYFAETLSISSISRSYPGTMYAGFGYSSQFPNSIQSYRVYKSVDSGNPGTWMNVRGDSNLPAKSEVTGIDMAFDNTNLVYAAIPDGPAPGIYKTIDGGDNWAQVFSEAPCRTVRLSPDASNIVVAGCNGGIFLSRNAGVDWDFVGPAITTHAIVFDPKNPKRVVIGTEGDLGSVYEVILPF